MCILCNITFACPKSIHHHQQQQQQQHTVISIMIMTSYVITITYLQDGFFSSCVLTHPFRLAVAKYLGL